MNHTKSNLRKCRSVASRLAVFLAIALASSASFATPAATQEWVRRYVLTNVATSGNIEITKTIATSNGTSTLSYTDPTGGLVTMTMNMQDKLALFATNCTAAAVALDVTNGTLFAWNGSTQFVNSVIGQTIYSVTTNCLTFAGVNSTTNEVGDTFAGYFDFYGCRIDRPTAATLLGE